MDWLAVGRSDIEPGARRRRFLLERAAVVREGAVGPVRFGNRRVDVFIGTRSAVLRI